MKARNWSRKTVEKWAGTWLARANEAAASGNTRYEMHCIARFQVWLDRLNVLDGSAVRSEV